MDFHQEFEKSLAAFPCLCGLIFADPDGESVLFEAPDMDPFEIRLAGAKIPILMNHYREADFCERPVAMELIFQNKIMLFIILAENYSITAIATDPTVKGRLKHHLTVLAHKFNQEIY